MVGDSRTDIDAARAAGVPVVAVDFGYTDVPVAELRPDRIISHFDDLRDAVAVDPRSLARAKTRGFRYFPAAPAAPRRLDLPRARAVNEGPGLKGD